MVIVLDKFYLMGFILNIVFKVTWTLLAYCVKDQYLEHHRPLPQCPQPLEPCFRELGGKKDFNLHNLFSKF